jgi:hypothetical protein
MRAMKVGEARKRYGSDPRKHQVPCVLGPTEMAQALVIVSLFHPDCDGFVTVWWRSGVSPRGLAEPLAIEAVDLNPHPRLELQLLFLPRRAAVVVQDLVLCRRDHSPSPEADRVVLAGS